MSIQFAYIHTCEADIISTPTYPRAHKQVLAAKRMLDGLPTASADFSSSYALGRKLGEGSFGTVFKATRTSASTASSTVWGGRSSWLGRESPAAAAASVFAVKQISKRGLDEIAADEVINEVRRAMAGAWEIEREATA